MTTQSITTMGLHPSPAQTARDRRDFRLIFGTAFVLCFFLTAFAHFMPKKWRGWMPSAQSDHSILEQTRSAASNAASFALMGW